MAANYNCEGVEMSAGDITWLLNTGWTQGADWIWVVPGRVEEVVAE